MDSPLLVRRDLDFLLHDWLRIDRLFARPRFADHSRETVDAVLDLSERLALDLFLPHYKLSDQVEPRLEADGVHVLPEIRAALGQHARLGLLAAGFAPEHGGMGLPFVICAASLGQCMAANIATASYAMLTAANARLLVAFASAAQIAAFALPQLAGDALGTMCLSEPDAGSSLADVRTRAVPDGSDDLGARFRLTGNKMWISGGDHDITADIVHLVLAKIPDADGVIADDTRGLSLFIVPKRLPGGAPNDVAVAGLNHKMGYRGTANCLLNFGERGGAIGWLVGEPGQGLPQMFHMMNEARITVGLGAAALGYRGYRHALAYARERRQGRLPGVRGGRPVAIVEHADVKRMLLAQKAYAEGALALVLYCAMLVDQADDPQSAELLGLLTPVAKTWTAEYGLAANDLAIQVHGGYGYTRDFDVEQLYRDNRLNPIHEGTTGIQAIDLLGRKILRDRGGMKVAAVRLGDTAARAAAIPALAAYADALGTAWARIETVVATLRDLPDPAAALSNATPFLSAFGHVVVGWLWLDQAIVANDLPADSHAGKLRACRFFFECELPKVDAWLDFVASGSDVAAGASPDWF